MYKAVKVRIYPDARQQAILRRHIGHSRYIFNAGLRRCIWAYAAALASGEKPSSPSHFTLTAWLTEFKRHPEVAFLNEVPVNVLSLSLERVARAYKNFFTRRHEGVGFPRFKGKHAPRTARYGRTVKVSADFRKVSLPPREVGWIRMRGYRPELAGKIKLATVEWAKSDRWYLSIMMDDGLAAPSAPAEIVAPRVLAVHCGLGDYVTTFDGLGYRHYPNSALLAQAEANLKRKERTLSRKAEASKRGPRDAEGKPVYSRRRERARIQRARVYEKVSNRRLDRANKLALEFVERADVIVLEAWGVKGMMGEKRFAKSIADAGWGQLQQRIEMKAKEYGKQVVKLEQYFPCSQICSSCEREQGTKVPLCEEWTCGHCGARHNRNVNAAVNVYRAGVAAI